MNDASATKSAGLGPAVEKAWVALLRSSQGVLGRVQADLKAAGFPALEWYDVLLELSRAKDGRMRQRDVAAKLLLARYNLSRLLDRLEEAELITREEVEEDARGAYATLTKKGRTLREQMWPAYAAAVRKHLGARLSDKEARTLAGLLTKLI